MKKKNGGQKCATIGAEENPAEFSMLVLAFACVQQLDSLKQCDKN